MKIAAARKKLNDRLDRLQELMKSNEHLNENPEIELLLSQLSIWFSAMTDEDRDFYQGVRYMVEEKIKWKND